MSKQSVDWNQLPHQPVQFFGLNPNFDRRDLKRAYGRLIHRFKPETHPEAFQRIRRAYEELENHLRYGVKQKIIARQTEAWTAVLATIPGKAEQQQRQTKVDLPASTTEQAIRSPRETYARLQQSPKRSAQDFFILAVLSDLVSTKD